MDRHGPKRTQTGAHVNTTPETISILFFRLQTLLKIGVDAVNHRHRHERQPCRSLQCNKKRIMKRGTSEIKKFTENRALFDWRPSFFDTKHFFQVVPTINLIN